LAELTNGTRCVEAYLYDFENADLACASCNPTGARPLGPAFLPTWTVPSEQPRYLSDDGSRLFFETFDALDLHDNNSKRDVYEFERAGAGSCTSASATFSSDSGGCLNLISTGSSSDNSYFVDASASGDDVFFSTRQRLTPTDEDERFDVYDARVEGGFSTPPSTPPCEGEACRPAQPAPSAVLPGTPAFFGAGNVKANGQSKPGCPKGKRSAQGNGKVRCAHKRRRRAHRRGKKRAHRNRGAGK
jgi:hypothetical protein